MKWLLLCFLTACGQAVAETPATVASVPRVVTQAPEMASTVASIEIKYSIHLNNIDFVFTPTFDSPYTVAVCSGFPYTPKITYSRLFWNAQDTDMRQIVLLHEVGHCYYGRLHLGGTLADGCPASIMIALFDQNIENCYAAHSAHYDQELKGG